MPNPFTPSYASLPEVIAIFPLPGAVLMPGTQLPLNIFEPRYLNLVEDTLGSHRLFGMIQPDPGGPRSGEAVLVVANFDINPQELDLSELGNRGLFGYGEVTDLYTGTSLEQADDRLVVPPRRFFWLTARKPGGLT